MPMPMPQEIVAVSQQDAQQRLLQTKTGPVVMAVITRLRSKDGSPSAEEAKFVRNGKILAQLKALGFELILDPQTTKMVIGRLPIENLEKLAELKAIRYIAPQLSN